MACFRDGATALGSSPEMTIAPTCCWVRLVMEGPCAAAFAEDGPTCLNCPLRALAASLPPEAAVSKYGLLICLGRNTMLRLPPVPVVGVVPPELPVPPPPQAASSNNTNTREPSVWNSFFTAFSFQFQAEAPPVRLVRGQSACKE